MEPEAGAVPHHVRHAARPPQGLVRRPRAAQPRRGQEVRHRQERARPGHRRLQGDQERAQRADRQPARRLLRVHAARARVDRRRDPAPALRVRPEPTRTRRPASTSRGSSARRELWFVPIVNPDGYDYTFTAPATRLWRKNLHDNNGDGAITNVDGVDTNRNWPEKWNYDLEGASNDPTSETFHGTGPASEPEVKALRGLIKKVDPAFLIDYHSFAQLILYPRAGRSRRPSTDAPLMASLAGDDDNPAVPGFDPDVSAELYTTNGDVTDDAYQASARWPTRSSSTAAAGRRSAARTAAIPSLQAWRLRLPGLRGRHRRPRRRRTSPSRSTWAARPTIRRTSSRTWATPRPTWCRRRSRSPTATRRPSRSTPSASSAP